MVNPLFFQRRLLLAITKNFPSFFKQNSLSRLILPELMAVLQHITLTAMVNGIIIILLAFAINYYTLRINTWHLKEVCFAKQQNRIHLANIILLWYRIVYIKTLKYLLYNNKYLGEIFLIILAFNFPVNCIIMIRLLKTEKFEIITFILITIIIEQTILILCIHWGIVSLNWNFSKSIFYFNNQFVEENCRLTTKHNVQLNLFIQTFRTAKKYGFTYDKYGLISMITFTKVFLLFFPKL